MTMGFWTAAGTAAERPLHPANESAPPLKPRMVHASCPDMMPAPMIQQPDGWMVEVPQGWLYSTGVMNPASGPAVIVCNFARQQRADVRNDSTHVFQTSRPLGQGVRAEQCSVSANSVVCR